MDLPTHKSEATGNAALDRIQNNVRQLYAYLKWLVADSRLTSLESRATSLESRATVLEDAEGALSLAADFSTTSAVAVATPLTFAVKAGEVWEIMFDGRAECSSVNGMQWAVGAPVGSTVMGWHVTSTTNTAVANWLGIAIDTINALYGACHVGANNLFRPDSFTANVKVAIDGFITVMVASVTAGTTTKIAAQSCLRRRKVVSV